MSSVKLSFSPDYCPAPRQAEFHALDCDEALFGGSAGPGKSQALLQDAIPQVISEHQRCERGELDWKSSTGVAIHFRREFPRLEETIARAKRSFAALYGDTSVSYDSTSHTFTFPSGFRYKFAHLKDSDSFLNHRSQQYTHIAFDELIEFEENQYHEMVGRCRSTDPVLSKMLKVRAASNPGPGWVRDYFVTPAPQGRVLLKKRFTLRDGTEASRSRIYIPARLYDNPNPEYVRQYELNLLDKPAHIRRALLNGDWYVVAGAFFSEEWDPDLVVVKPFKIPGNWKRFRSGDWGYKTACVIHWWAVSPDGELVCYRERTFKRKTAYEVAEAIRDIEQSCYGEWDEKRRCSRLTGPMDTNLWSEAGHRGPTMADDMASIGVYWVKATKGRRQAAQHVMGRLKDRGENGRPGIMFFDTCKMSITTIPAIGTDPDDPEVPLKGGSDHWYDSVSYACASIQVPSVSKDGEDWDDFPEDEVAERRIGNKFGYGQH